MKSCSSLLLTQMEFVYYYCNANLTTLAFDVTSLERVTSPGRLFFFDD